MSFLKSKEPVDYIISLIVKKSNKIFEKYELRAKYNNYRLPIGGQMPTVSAALQMGGLIWRGIITWNKGLEARAPHKGYFRHQCEYIIWGTNGKCPKAKQAGPYPGCFDFSVKQKGQILFDRKADTAHGRVSTNCSGKVSYFRSVCRKRYDLCSCQET